jgi:hypothetical protein
MELALCYTCFMAKWRTHSKFLGDIPPDAQGELCAQCHGAVAIVRVDYPCSKNCLRSPSIPRVGSIAFL